MTRQFKLLDLDIAADQNHNDVVAWAATHGCQAGIAMAKGPAGGNPLYTFSGTAECLKALEADYHS